MLLPQHAAHLNASNPKVFLPRKREKRPEPNHLQSQKSILCLRPSMKSGGTSLAKMPTSVLKIGKSQHNASTTISQP